MLGTIYSLHVPAPFRCSAWATLVLCQPVSSKWKPIWCSHLIICEIGWCDYLVCCVTSCPPEMSAAEFWRMSRGKEKEYAHAIFDFDADADPESRSHDWM